MNTYERLEQRENTNDFVKQFLPAINRMNEIKNDQTPYSLSGSINKSNAWSLDLFKPVFAITKLEGEIDEIKLYCSKKYVFFRFEKDKKFEIPENYGDCRVSLIGTPNSTFELIQLGRS